MRATQGDTFRFATPTQKQRGPLGTSLLSQIQRLGPTGHIVETFDVLAIGTLGTLFAKEIRHFSSRWSCSPNLTVVGDACITDCVKASHEAHTVRKVVGAGIGKRLTDADPNESPRPFWANGIFLSMKRKSNGNYELWVEGHKAAKWQRRRWKEVRKTACDASL